MKKVISFGIFLTALILSRSINLERNYRFNRDESSDLVKIHQYWQDKEISLIGPISEDGNQVYSSLSYYLVMPVTAVMNFSAVAPAIGTAIWSVLIGVMLWWWLYKHKRLNFWSAGLIVVWTPLVIAGRWAWNPNLGILWMTAGWWLWDNGGQWRSFLGGIFMGTAAHHHYLQLIGGAVLAVFQKNRLAATIGLMVPIAVFVAFDLIHPPGLFITRALIFKGSRIGFDPDALRVAGEYFWGIGVWFWLGWLGVAGLMINDFRERNENRKYWLALAALTVTLFFIKRVEGHYWIGGLLPLWLSLTNSREGWAERVRLMLVIMIVGVSIYRNIPIIAGKQPDDSVKNAVKISRIIGNNINEEKLINPNLCVLQSSDINSVGLKYRDLLLIEGIALKSKDEYSISDNLYVITQNGNEAELRQDQSVQMKLFANGPGRVVGSVGDNNWKVWRFDKY